jgi:hypothetical protein
VLGTCVGTKLNTNLNVGNRGLWYTFAGNGLPLHLGRSFGRVHVSIYKGTCGNPQSLMCAAGENDICRPQWLQSTLPYPPQGKKCNYVVNSRMDGGQKMRRAIFRWLAPAPTGNGSIFSSPKRYNQTYRNGRSRLMREWLTRPYVVLIQVNNL